MLVASVSVIKVVVMGLYIDVADIGVGDIDVGDRCW